jgi:Mn2+/Fe2+ NRAMP family transporter
MGDYRNGFWGNAVAGTTSILMVALTVVMIWTGFSG